MDAKGEMRVLKPVVSENSRSYSLNVSRFNGDKEGESRYKVLSPARWA